MTREWKENLFLLALSAIAVIVFFATSAAAADLKLVEYGSRSTSDSPTPVAVYKVTVGDPSKQETLAHSIGIQAYGYLLHFSQNAAQYFPNGDGTWRMRTLRMPQNNMESQLQFRDYLLRADVIFVLERIDQIGNFGMPGDFIYMRRMVLKENLPEPWNQMSDKALASVVMIQQFIADGTQKAYLAYPVDEEGKAQEALKLMQGTK